MLNSLRQSAGSWVVKGFLGILVLSFALWGIEDVFRIQPDTAVATVGDVDITSEQFLSEFNAELRRLQATLGPSFDSEQARAMGLTDAALQRLTRRALYDQEVARLGLTMTDTDVLEAIRTNPAFQGELGNFDRFLFESRLAQAGFSEANFVAATRADGARNQLLGAVASGVRVAPEMIDVIYRHEQEERVFEVATVAHDSLRDSAQPDEAALQAFYAANENQFMAPEYRALTFMLLRPEALTDEILVSEEEVRDVYEARRLEFTREEQRRIEQILVPDEAAATAIVAALREGRDFLAVAREQAGQDEAAVALGLLTETELFEEVREQVFQLSVNEISEPLQSPLGWHVFRVLEIVPGSTLSFEDTRQEILEELKLEGARDALFELANRIEDELAGGAGLEEVAGTLNLSTDRVAAVDAGGRDPADQPVANLPAAPEFLGAAFAAQPGDELALEESDDGSYFLVRVDSVTAPALRPLADVRDEVRDGVVAEQSAEAADARSQMLAEKARGGAAMSDLAMEAGSTLVVTEPLIRAQAPVSANLSAELVDQLFAMQVGDVAAGRGLDGASHLVVKVTEIRAAEPGADSQGVGQLTQLLQQSQTGDILGAYRTALSASYPTEVNHGVIAQLFDERALRR